MVKQTIQIFARIKPTKLKTGGYEIIEEENGSPELHFTVPRDLNEGLVNNKKELYKFKFSRVFDRKIKQDEIFEHVAQPVINNVISGYNGTIFAYGQTGSGKTFTITGGAERYLDRGIIPRTLSYIYEYYGKNPDWEYSTHISYLEIYNDNGYDLLDPKHESAKLEDLPKVSLMEDADQNVHLKNLSTHQAANEEEALNLLFLGDTNRMIAETPMNQASTRSHCIFTIHVSSRESGAATLRRSKLHLVDLAGSERVAKTGVGGLLLTEAKYINLSLHYLEQVIVSLSEKTRSHIPYRNSLMTSVLRDSLGGNCMTTMIATCSVEKKNIDESISTCRFAQRVAMIKNDAILNEELDPKLMIAKLKRDVQSLKDQLVMATGQTRTDELSEEDLEICEEAVNMYMNSSDPDATIDVGSDLRKIHRCFWIMKKQALERKLVVPSASQVVVSPSSTRCEETPRMVGDQTTMSAQEVKKLKDILQQRDNEINILVNMLKKEKKRAAETNGQLDRLSRAAPTTVRSEGTFTNGQGADGPAGTSPSPSPGAVDLQPGKEQRKDMRSRGSSAPGLPLSNKKLVAPSRENSEFEEKTKRKILGDMSIGRQEAFELFRRDYSHNQMIDDNKMVLKQRYAEAKSLGEAVNQARVKINKLKGSIEQHRMSRVMQGLVNPDNPEPDAMELDMKKGIEDEKNAYKHAFSRLRTLKTEIEHLQHLLERSKVKLMKDFEIWWAEQGALNVMQQQHQQVSPPSGNVKSAWRTPPMSPQSRGPMQAFPDSPNVSSLSESTHSSVDMNRAPIPGHIRQSLANTNIPARDRSHAHEQPPQGTHKTKSASTGIKNKIPLTGDAKADADILAFLKARQNLLKHL